MKLTAVENKKLGAALKTVQDLGNKMRKPDPAPKKPAPKTNVKQKAAAKPLKAAKKK